MSGNAKCDIFYPWYVGDYQADTMHLDATGHGIYRQLLDAYWMRQGPLPANDAILMQISRATPAQWKALKPIIAAFFRVTDTHWHHGRVEQEIQKARDQKLVKSKAGIAGNKVRWGNREDIADGSQTDRRRIAEPVANSIANPIAKHRPSPSPSPSPVLAVQVSPPLHGFGAVGAGEERGQTLADFPPPEPPAFANHPPLSVVQEWVRSECPGIPEADVLAAWQRLEAGAIDGQWMWFDRPTLDWRNTFTSHLSGISIKNRKNAPHARGIGAAFPTEKPNRDRIVPTPV